jgi:hypothetical protein
VVAYGVWDARVEVRFFSFRQSCVIIYYMGKTLKNISKKELEQAIKKSSSMTEVIINLGFRVNNGKFPIIKSKAKEFDLVLPTWNGETSSAQKSSIMSDEDFFVKGVLRNSTTAKNRLKKLGIEYLCSNSTCGLNKTNVWAGMEIKLQLDHIDGDRFNNQLSNLRLLCPNCHSQTETFARNNSKKYDYCTCGRRVSNKEVGLCIHKNSCKDCDKSIDKASTRCLKCDTKHRKNSKLLVSDKYQTLNVDEVLESVLKKGYSQTAKIFGASDNGIRKFLSRNGKLPAKSTRNKFTKLDESCTCGRTKNRSSKTCIECSYKEKTKFIYPSDSIIENMIKEEGIVNTYKKLNIPRNSFYSYIKKRNLNR